MTNEEKAKEIAELHGICYKNHSKYESDMDSTLECYRSAIQMAEWKDEQLKAEKQALINKAMKYLAPMAYTHKHLIDLDNFIEYMEEK